MYLPVSQCLRFRLPSCCGKITCFPVPCVCTMPELPCVPLHDCPNSRIQLECHPLSSTGQRAHGEEGVAASGLACWGCRSGSAELSRQHQFRRNRARPRPSFIASRLPAHRQGSRRLAAITSRIAICVLRSSRKQSSSCRTDRCTTWLPANCLCWPAWRCCSSPATRRRAVSGRCCGNIVGTASGGARYAPCASFAAPLAAAALLSPF